MDAGIVNAYRNEVYKHLTAMIDLAIAEDSRSALDQWKKASTAMQHLREHVETEIRLYESLETERDAQLCW